MTLVPSPEPFPLICLSRAASRIIPREGTGENSLALESVESGTGRLVHAPWIQTENPGNAFEYGDILFGKLRPYLAKVWVADRTGSYVGDFIHLRTSTNFNAAFLKYAFLTPQFIGTASAESSGSKMPRTEWDRLKAIHIPAPSLDDQRRIADYLDHETAEIDALLSDLDALAKLLAEHRTLSIEGSFAAISDRSPRLRDLGVKKASGYSANGGATAALTHELGVLKTGSVSKGYFDSSENKVVDEHSEISKLCTPVTKGTVIVNRANTPALVGAAGYVSENHENLFVSDLLWELTLPNQLSEVFYFYTLTRQYREQIDLISVGASSTMKKIRFDDLSRMRVPFPHDSLVGSFLDEQRIIVERHAELHEEIVRSMDLAKERRVALISAAVTGQIDVTSRRRGPSEAERLESDLAPTQ